MTAPLDESGAIRDEALIVAIAGGDTHALGMLYERYASTLLAIGERLIGSRRDAEDLVHDVFIEVWKHAWDFRAGRGSVRTWLLVRLRSRSIDRRRSAASSRSVPLDDHPGAWLATAESADELGPDRARVRRALESLSPEQREVLLLGYFEDLTSVEIATRLSVPVGTVKSRVASARKRLESLLQVHVEGRS
jgi:RNA polymerase sigma-70 factor (ECF subfamily)